jgi:hypothetical protein
MNPIIGSFHVRPGMKVNVHLGRYGNGRLAVQLLAAEDGQDGDIMEGETWAVLSVNLTHEPDPGPRAFYAKTWSENEPLREPALASSLFVDTGQRSRSDFIEAELWQFAEAVKF